MYVNLYGITSFAHAHRHAREHTSHTRGHVTHASTPSRTRENVAWWVYMSPGLILGPTPALAATIIYNN